MFDFLTRQENIVLIPRAFLATATEWVIKCEQLRQMSKAADFDPLAAVVLGRDAIERQTVPGEQRVPRRHVHEARVHAGDRADDAVAGLAVHVGHVYPTPLID